MLVVFFLLSSIFVCSLLVPNKSDEFYCGVIIGPLHTLQSNTILHLFSICIIIPNKPFKKDFRYGLNSDFVFHRYRSTSSLEWTKTNCTQQMIRNLIYKIMYIDFSVLWIETKGELYTSKIEIRLEFWDVFHKNCEKIIKVKKISRHAVFFLLGHIQRKGIE